MQTTWRLLAFTIMCLDDLFNAIKVIPFYEESQHVLFSFFLALQDVNGDIAYIASQGIFFFLCVLPIFISNCNENLFFFQIVTIHQLFYLNLRLICNVEYISSWNEWNARFKINYTYLKATTSSGEMRLLYFGKNTVLFAYEYIHV